MRHAAHSTKRLICSVPTLALSMTSAILITVRGAAMPNLQGIETEFPASGSPAEAVEPGARSRRDRVIAFEHLHRRAQPVGRRAQPERPRLGAPSRRQPVA